MKIRRKVFHYPMSGFLMGIGFVVSFICFFNCLNLQHLMKNEQREKNNYQYQSEVSFSYYNSYGESVLDAGLASDRGNVILNDIWLYRKNADAMGITDIICAQNEPLSYPVVEGVLPESDQEVEIPMVILGIGLKKEADERNGVYYYTIEQRRYRVCAFIGSNKSDVFDYKVILYGKTMERTLWEKIDNEQGAEGIIGSNKESAYSICEALKDKADAKWEGVVIGALNVSDMQMAESSDSQAAYYIIILLFCLVNMIFVSEYWIRERYKEIAIRKIFGYRDSKIVLFIYKELVKTAAAAVLAACVLQGILFLFIEEYIQLYMSQFWFYLLVCVVFVALSGVLLILYPLFIMRKDDALQQILKGCL